MLRKRNLEESDNHDLAATQDQIRQTERVIIGEVASGESIKIVAAPSSNFETTTRVPETDAIAALLGLLFVYLIVEVFLWLRRKCSRTAREDTRRADAQSNPRQALKASGSGKGSNKGSMRSPKTCRSKASGSRRSSYSPLAATSAQCTDVSDACSESGSTFSGIV